ncbi:MAG: PKD domain-containing protein, partial [Myxococcota bacterium]
VTLPIGIGADEGVLVNQTAQSFPAMAVGLTGLSLKGLEAARSDLNDPHQPSVSIEPAGGFYAETLRVRVVALPGPQNPSPVVIHWKVNGGSAQSLQAEEAEFFLFEPGKHVVTYRVSQGGKQTAFVDEDYEIDAKINPMRDTDGDGLPDAWEIANGLDPLSADAGQDRDGDGTSDFDEILRGTDPDNPNDHPTNLANDPDCDGWSTWDEDRRGTDQDAPGIPFDLDQDSIDESCEPATPWPSRPVARRSAEVEYTLAGGAWMDLARSMSKTDLGRLSVMDPYGEVLFDQAALPGLEDFVQAGWIAANLPDAQVASAIAQAELQLPSWLRAGEVAAPLSAGALPAVRVPGGNASIVRVRDEDAAGLPGLWVAKAWLAPSPDRTPAAYNEYVAAEIESGNDISWTTAAEWQNGYEAYFSAGVVQAAPLQLDPGTGLALALLEAAVSWHSEQSSGGEILLGNPDVEPRRDAVSSLGETLAALERNLEGLLEDFEPLVEPGGDLMAFRGSVLGYFADPSTIPPPEAPDTTETGAAALLQGMPGDDDTLAAYTAKLYALASPKAIADLTPAERATLLDPNGDADGDGVSNAAEVAVKAAQSGDPSAADSDGDGFPDGMDPCIADPDNTCLALLDLEGDDDDDGVVNALDNCLNDANAEQADTNGDAIGDACLRYANIRTPVANVRVYPGTSINFTSIVTEKGSAATAPLDFAWSFGGGATDSMAANPGPVSFDLPGTWPVALVVRDGDDEDLGADVRSVTVLGDVPLVAIVGAGPLVEGETLSLFAAASSPNGAITGYAWDFGDGQADTGASVSHDWIQDGSYPLSVSVQDAIGAPATDSLMLTVSDTGPEPDFTLDRERGPAPHTVQFSDATPVPYDGLAGLLWNFGDGSSTSTQSAPAHLFTTAATPTVELVATDGDGSVAVTSRRVQVLTGFNLLADVDSDGMADSYELAHGLSLPSLDSDADGMSDAVEYQAATDPGNPLDVPPGDGGISTLLFADGFDEPLEQRWSLGLASALAAPSALASSGRATLDVQQPLVGELCQTASLVAFPSVAGADLDVSASLDPGSGGRSCVGLARGVDYFTRVEACLVEAPAGFSAELRRVEGNDTEVISAGSVNPSGDVQIGLQKIGKDFYLTLSGNPVAGVPSAGSLGDSDLRAYVSAESCPEDLALTEVDVDSLEVTQLPEAGATLQLLAGLTMLRLLARRRRGPSPSSRAVRTSGSCRWA